MPEIKVSVGSGKDYNLPQKAEFFLQWYTEKGKWEDAVKKLESEHQNASSFEKLALMPKLVMARGKLKIAQEKSTYWRNQALEEARPGGMLLLGLVLGSMIGYVGGQWSLMKKQAKKKK